MIKFHQKNFIESVPYDKVNPEKIRYNNDCYYNNIENKMTRFQIYPEIELACRFKTPFYKTQYSEVLVEYEKAFDMSIGKLRFEPSPAF